MRSISAFLWLSQPSGHFYRSGGWCILYTLGHFCFSKRVFVHIWECKRERERVKSHLHLIGQEVDWTPAAYHTIYSISVFISFIILHLSPSVWLRGKKDFWVHKDEKAIEPPSRCACRKRCLIYISCHIFGYCGCFCIQNPWMFICLSMAEPQVTFLFELRVKFFQFDEKIDSQQ